MRILRYFLQFSSQGSMNPLKNFKRKYSCSTNCSGLGDASTKRSSSTHRYSIISNQSQQQFQDLNSLSLNSTIQVRKQKRIENKFASKNEASSVGRPMRDTNLDIWYNRRLEFGSSILKFGLRSKDIIIVVFNQNDQRDLKNSVRQPQSCLRERDIQNAKDKWSQFIRNVNRASLIVYMEIKELEDNQIIQEAPRKQMDNTCTVNQNQERVIRVTARKQFTRQYNLQLTIFTINGCARTSKDLLLEVIDYFLDHVAKENRKNELGSYSYSQILKKEKPNAYPPTPLPEPSQPKSTRPKKQKTIINTQLNFQKPLPQDFKAVKDQTHLRGSSMPMRTPFKQSVSLSKRATTASTVEQEKFKSQKKSNNNTKGWFDFMKTFWLNGTITNSQIQQPSSSKGRKLK